MQRVAAYYGDEDGKVKKRIQNGKRTAVKAEVAPAAIPIRCSEHGLGGFMELSSLG